jgi:hypothetical protein
MLTLDKSPERKRICAIMQILLDMRKLKDVAAAQGFAMREICKVAGVNPSTASRMARGTGHVRTLTKLNLALAGLIRDRRQAQTRNHARKETA